MASLFSAPKAPPIIAPAVAPTMNSAAVQAAQQSTAAAAMARSGRQSTILTDTKDKFGE